MCVTSPPYFGMRDYGEEEQIGLEKTPKEFIDKLVAIFSEVNRVLKPEGTLWLNLGDTYNNSPTGAKTVKKLKEGSTANVGNLHESNLKASKTRKVIRNENLKQKDLIGVPWRTALALQQSGWYLRSDIIWHKPNAMPESVKDRPTKAHEYIFLLSKSKKYYYDQDAIREPLKESSKKRAMRGVSAKNKYADDNHKPGGVHANTMSQPRKHLGYDNMEEKIKEGKTALNPKGRNRRTVWEISTKPLKEAHFAAFPPDLIEPCILAGCPEDGIVLDPFMGAGTTAMVSIVNNRNFVGFEINKEFINIAYKRIGKYDKKYYQYLPDKDKPSQTQLF